MSSESDQRRELAKQLAVSVKQRDSLRDKVVKVMAQNRKLLSGYRSLMAKVKERQERLMEAEQHYQESRFQHGWGEEDLASCRRLNLRHPQEGEAGYGGGKTSGQADGRYFQSG